MAETIFTLMWVDPCRSHEIIGGGDAVMAVYSLLRSEGVATVIHVFRQGEEYDPEIGLLLLRDSRKAI